MDKYSITLIYFYGNITGTFKFSSKMPKCRWIFFREFCLEDALLWFLKTNQLYICKTLLRRHMKCSSPFMHFASLQYKRQDHPKDAQKLKLFVSDKAMLFPCSWIWSSVSWIKVPIQSTDESRRNRSRSSTPAAGHGATLCEMSGTGPTVSFFNCQRVGVNN